MWNLKETASLCYYKRVRVCHSASPPFRESARPRVRVRIYPYLANSHACVVDQYDGRSKHLWIKIQNELCLLVCWVCTLGLYFNLCNVFAWGAVKSDKVCDEHSSAKNCENKSVEYGRKRAIFDLYFDVQSEPVGPMWASGAS